VRQNQGIVGALDHAEAYQLALEAIDRALAIDPNFAFAIASRAWLAMTHERDLVTATRHFNRAIELAPNEPTILSNAAVLARQLGRVERAIELTRRSITLNPVAAAGYINLSDQLSHARRYAESIEAANRALELSPGHPTAMVNLAVSHVLNDEPGEALRVAESIDMPFYREFLSALASFDLGQLAASDAALSAVIEGYADQRASYVAVILARRGETDQAFDWLQRAIDEGQRILGVRTEPLYDNLRGDPRWRRILEQLNLSDAQVAGLEI
jgi:tetratricopeptide (TPR) repeat protein